MLKDPSGQGLILQALHQHLKFAEVTEIRVKNDKTMGETVLSTRIM